MDNDTGSDPTEEGAGSGAPAPLRPLPDNPRRGASYLQFFRRVGPALTLPLDQWPCSCLGCCLGANCEREMDAERRAIERERDEERRKRWGRESELRTERARVAESKQIARDTIGDLLKDWRKLARPDQDRREAEYSERFRDLLAILGDDPERWLPSLLAKDDAHRRRRPRIEDEPDAPKLELARQALIIMRDEPRPHRLSDIADRLGMIVVDEFADDKELRKATDAGEAALRRHIERFKDLGWEL